MQSLHPAMVSIPEDVVNHLSATSVTAAHVKEWKMKDRSFPVGVNLLPETTLDNVPTLHFMQSRASVWTDVSFEDLE